ncbi:uncharacterized protein LOC144746211 [Ciona intestinalis]
MGTMFVHLDVTPENFDVTTLTPDDVMKHVTNPRNWYHRDISRQIIQSLVQTGERLQLQESETNITKQRPSKNPDHYNALKRYRRRKEPSLLELVTSSAKEGSIKVIITKKRKPDVTLPRIQAPLDGGMEETTKDKRERITIKESKPAIEEMPSAREKEEKIKIPIFGKNFTSNVKDQPTKPNPPKRFDPVYGVYGDSLVCSPTDYYTYDKCSDAPHSGRSCNLNYLTPELDVGVAGHSPRSNRVAMPRSQSYQIAKLNRKKRESLKQNHDVQHWTRQHCPNNEVAKQQYKLYNEQISAENKNNFKKDYFYRKFDQAEFAKWEQNEHMTSSGNRNSPTDHFYMGAPTSERHGMDLKRPEVIPGKCDASYDVMERKRRKAFERRQRLNEIREANRNNIESLRQRRILREMDATSERMKTVLDSKLYRIFGELSTVKS